MRTSAPGGASLPPFQQFQHDFGLHLRNPRSAPRPQGVPARRAGVYRELLFNNICGVVDACFPVSRDVLGTRRWLRLQKAFFAEWRSQTPLFCELSREFLRYLNEADLPLVLPPFLLELAHYEWVELAVDIMQTPELPALSAEGDLLQERPVVAPAHMLLSYQWPVQSISAHYRPRKASPVQLVVFRDQTDKVQFAAINAVTARLVALLAAGKLTGKDACLQVAKELQHPNPVAVVEGGAQMLNDLRNWGVIYGTA